MEDLIAHVAESFRHTDMLHRRVLEKGVNKTGVHRSQHHLLMVIVAHRLSSQKEIADRLGISTAAVAVSLKKLEKVGYIKKRIDQEDNRFNKIDITEEGLNIIEESKKVFFGIDKEMFKGFSKEETEHMLRYLDKMYTNLIEIESKIEREREVK